MLFKYFDNKNKTRLNKLNTKAGITKDLTTILRIGNTILKMTVLLCDILDLFENSTCLIYNNDYF